MDRHLDADHLSDYAEGLLDAEARARADGHLAGCAECRRELSAIRSYFRELSGLEPVRAPADFLAKVRARLPRPSPWKRAWSVLPAFIRIVPMPIAVAVVLGVTAITVYIRQGGLEERTAVPASAPAPSALDDAREAAGAGGGPDIAAERRKLSEAPARAPSAQASKPAGLKKSLGRARPAPSDGAGRSDAHEAGRTPSDETVRNIASSSGLDLDAAPASPPAPAPASAPAPSRVREGKAKRSQEAAEGMAFDEAAPRSVGKAEAGGGGAARDREEASGPIVVTLRRAADTASVLNGLRNMGIEVGPSPGSSGEGSHERRYRLYAPRSMAGGIHPYLERYGSVRSASWPPEGPATDPLIADLRILIP